MKDLCYLERFREKEAEKRIGLRGDSHNGVFKVFLSRGRGFRVIATNTFPWEHVSVTPSNQQRKSCPTWDEMCEIKDMFFEDEEQVVQFHPKKSEYVNIHPYCLHLWRKMNGRLNEPYDE